VDPARPHQDGGSPQEQGQDPTQEAVVPGYVHVLSAGLPPFPFRPIS